MLPWRDVLHEGPVPLTDTLEELTEIRANYLAKDDGDLDHTRAILQARDRGLARSAQFDRVALWFEHDLYDQLQLLQLLHWFHDHPRDEETLLLVQATDFLGNQTPESILQFQNLERPVGSDQLALAREAWDAFRATTPEPWRDLLDRDLSPLPYLKPAVLRMLEELPGRDGLSRTERQILLALQSGSATPSALFAAVQRQEEAVFMGDLSFFRLLDGLALAQEPLVDGLRDAPFRADGSGRNRPYLQSELALTPFGREVLADRADHIARNGIDRRGGGTHLTSASPWRWDSERQDLIPASG